VRPARFQSDAIIPLERGCVRVEMPPDVSRPVDPKYASMNGAGADPRSLAQSSALDVATSGPTPCDSTLADCARYR